MATVQASPAVQHPGTAMPMPMTMGKQEVEDMFKVSFVFARGCYQQSVAT
jgi:hypothetical protein